MPFPFAAAASLLGSAVGLYEGHSNRQEQRKYAQNGIQWRVADAQRAGIHPLYALGANTPSFSPVSTYAADGIAQAGQDLSRAQTAAQDRRERERDRQHAVAVANTRARKDDPLARLNTERAQLENDLLRSQIARLNSAQVGPAAPSFGSSNARPGAIDSVPATVEVGSIGEPARAPGAINDIQYARRPDGGLGIVPSEQMKERMEDYLPEQISWFLRNNMIPGVTRELRAPSTREYPLPPGMVWRWDSRTQSYQPRRR